MLQKTSKARLLQREVLPFVASFALLALLALALDGLLHALDLRWVGRWLGIPGTLLIIASTVYSLRKRRLIRRGQPAQLLKWHESLAWLGHADQCGQRPDGQVPAGTSTSSHGGSPEAPARGRPA